MSDADGMEEYEVEDFQNNRQADDGEEETFHMTTIYDKKYSSKNADAKNRVDDEDDDLSHMKAHTKLGGKCCGYLCDYRKAVFIVMTMYIFQQCLALVTYIATNVAMRKAPVDDDDLVEFATRANRFAALFVVFSLLTSAMALVGALRFNIWLVATNVIWIVTNFIVAISYTAKINEEMNEHYDYEDYGEASPTRSPGLLVVHTIMMILLVYPQIGFIREVRLGIMSYDTYHTREAYSCCCNRRFLSKF